MRTGHCGRCRGGQRSVRRRPFWTGARGFSGRCRWWRRGPSGGIRLGEEFGAHEDVALALCERSLVAIARGEWGRAEDFADQARAVLRRAGIEDSYATPLVCAAQARAAMHRGDVPAARRELVTAQRLRHLLTYALPYFAVQARVELTRVHLALADLAGARTLMREVDELLRRRPGLGTLAGEAKALRARLAKERGSSASGASALTAADFACCRCSPPTCRCRN